MAEAASRGAIVIEHVVRHLEVEARLGNIERRAANRLINRDRIAIGNRSQHLSVGSSTPVRLATAFAFQQRVLLKLRFDVRRQFQARAAAA